MERVLLSLTSSQVAVAGNPITAFISSQLFSPATARDITKLGLILALLQVLDGILTAIGVGHFGTAAEGNILIRFLMENFGYVPALLFVKTLAMAVIVCMCVLAGRVYWLGSAMRVVILVYLCAAVIPWSYIIVRHIV